MSIASNSAWWREGLDFARLPHMVTDSPGPESQKMHARAAKIMKGLSSQVKLHPVCFKEGFGVTLTDVDGNTYIDFSSGIYVTTLGHCHPKISQAVAKAANTLMNCHDFTTPVKTELLEKLVAVLPGGLNGVQLYDSGTTAVEAAIRAARAHTGKHEFLGFMMDFHGKSGHSVSLAKMNATNGAGRAQGFYMLPKPYPYRPLFKKADGTIDTDAFIDYYEYFVDNATTNQIAAVVIEPIQGWGGSVIPPDDFMPKLQGVLRAPQDAADRRRSPDQHGPHRQVDMHGALGRGAGHRHAWARGSATASRSRPWWRKRRSRSRSRRSRRPPATAATRWPARRRWRRCR